MKDTSRVIHGDTMDQVDATIESDKGYDKNEHTLSYINIKKNKDMDCIKQVRLRQKFIE